MESIKWIDLIGLSSEDSKVRAGLSQAGVKSGPKLDDDESSTNIHLPDVMLRFSATEVYPDIEIEGDEASILSMVFFPLRNRKWGQYDGPLFLALDRGDSRDKLRKRFGEPLDSNKKFRWDEWLVGERLVRAEYTEDWSTLEAVALALPDPE